MKVNSFVLAAIVNRVIPQRTEELSSTNGIIHQWVPIALAIEQIALNLKLHWHTRSHLLYTRLNLRHRHCDCKSRQILKINCDKTNYQCQPFFRRTGDKHQQTRLCSNLGFQNFWRLEQRFAVLATSNAGKCCLCGQLSSKT